ncbi:MAG TPA: TetR/AcrR family transcriptional regulator [Deltaproteobacteria bacterium]|nr:TetR/AcrR family transcriptional regulator [Deltaproteobacteria bacterium]
MKRPRSPEEIERIKGRIIDAALAIIVEEGFPCLTIRRLASRLHMSAPNLYNFFKSKDEIYITIVIRGFQMLHDELVRASETGPGPAERARAMLEAYIAFGTSNQAYYDIMFTLPTPKYRDYVGTPYERLSEAEYRISMEIAALATQALRDIKGGEGLSEEELAYDIVRIWCMVHGMVSLANSRIIGYVAPDIEESHARIIDDLINHYAASRDAGEESRLNSPQDE